MRSKFSTNLSRFFLAEPDLYKMDQHDIARKEARASAVAAARAAARAARDGVVKPACAKKLDFN